MPPGEGQDGTAANELELFGLTFRKTCSACPEQYEVRRRNEQVAYVRLRHGTLTVEAPDHGHDLVLKHKFARNIGAFDDDERRPWLERIARLVRDRPAMPTAMR